MSLSSVNNLWSKTRLFHKIILGQNVSSILCRMENPSQILNLCRNSNKKYFMTGSHKCEITKTTGAEYLYEKKEPWVKALVKKLGWKFLYQGKFKFLGYELYESVVKDLNYLQFFKEFEMEDTFFSWFLIIELHIWMISVRVMRDEDYGKTVRDGMIQTMWTDVSERTKHLTLLKSTMSKEIQSLSDEFRAALLNYDEGLLSDDKVLAAALWRRFFCKECDNPVLIERLVHYVRQNISVLESLTNKELFVEKKLTLVKLEDIPMPLE